MCCTTHKNRRIEFVIHAIRIYIANHRVFVGVNAPAPLTRFPRLAFGGLSGEIIHAPLKTDHVNNPHGH